MTGAALCATGVVATADSTLTAGDAARLPAGDAAFVGAAFVGGATFGARAGAGATGLGGGVGGTKTGGGGGCNGRFSSTTEMHRVTGSLGLNSCKQRANAGQQWYQRTENHGSRAQKAAHSNCSYIKSMRCCSYEARKERTNTFLYHTEDWNETITDQEQNEEIAPCHLSGGSSG